MSYRKAKLLLEQKKMQQNSIAKNQAAEINQQQRQQMQIVQKKKNNVFAAFEDDGDDSDEPQTKITQKKGELKSEHNEIDTKKKKNKKKKKKNKDETQKTEKKEQEVDVEKVFKEMGLQYKGNKQEQDKEREGEDWQRILHINENKFNYQKQLRKHFGNVGLGEEKVEQPDLSKKQQRFQKHLKKSMKKSTLSPGVKDVFIIREKFEVDRDESRIKFLPTKKYDHYQAEYDAIRNSNDINALFMFMQTHPEHVDSIYAVGEFLRLQGNYRDADNLIQRVIYIYEMAAPYDLTEFIKEDFVKKQIVYETYSISLFMSLFKFMDILGKKGCYRAALQYNKFLLKINVNDPTACILCMDFNSISAKCSDYLIQFVQNFGRYIGRSKSSLYLLPNFTYSIALAKYYTQSEKQEKGLVVEETNPQVLNFTEQDWKIALTVPNDDSFTKQNARSLILRAMLIYPRLILEIANKNEYAKQFVNFQSFIGNQKKSYKDILAHDFWTLVPTSYSYHFLKLQNIDDSTGLDKILQVYVERSKILWKSNQVMLWVKGAMGFLLNKIDNKQFDYQSYLEKLCTQEGGGIVIPFQLRRYSNVSKHNFSDRVDRIDLANIQDNQRQQAPRNENRMNLEGNPITMFLNSLLPWVNLPNAQSQEDPDMPDIHDDD